MIYRAISEGNLDILKTNDQYLRQAERIKPVDSSKLTKVKEIRFAPIPKFNQETQAVYQDKIIDMGEYISAGVKIVDLPPEKPLYDIGKEV